MPQIARSLISSSEDALDDLVNGMQEAALRERVRNVNKREIRKELRALPKRYALIGNTCAPGVDVFRYLGVELRSASMKQYPIG